MRFSRRRLSHAGHDQIKGPDHGEPKFVCCETTLWNMLSISLTIAASGCAWVIQLSQSTGLRLRRSAARVLSHFLSILACMASGSLRRNFAVIGVRFIRNTMHLNADTMDNQRWIWYCCALASSRRFLARLSSATKSKTLRGTQRLVLKTSHDRYRSTSSTASKP